VSGTTETQTWICIDRSPHKLAVALAAADEARTLGLALFNVAKHALELQIVDEGALLAARVCATM
jgi:hypothetical protein